MSLQIYKPKMVYVLSHWDEGVLGIYDTLNRAKNRVRYVKDSNYAHFYKTKWGSWSYYHGGFEIDKMTEHEAEILFRWNED